MPELKNAKGREEWVDTEVDVSATLVASVTAADHYFRSGTRMHSRIKPVKSSA